MRPLPYGASPWPQAFWDPRAAANFVCGGMGGGLVAGAALSGVPAALPLLAGLVLVACGLLAVFAEIGRPLRAANVVRNAATSWMTREALVAPLLFAATLAAAFVAPAFAPLAGVLAVAFVYCQGRMLHAARGIPAWRAAPVPWLVVATGLAEGTGLWLALAAATPGPTGRVALACAVAVAVRFALWRAYRAALPGTLAAEARTALDGAGRVLAWLGTAVPLALLAPLLLGALPAAAQPLAAVAGLAAAAAGAWTKGVIVLRAGHVQGFALAALPVRGRRA